MPPKKAISERETKKIGQLTFTGRTQVRKKGALKLALCHGSTDDAGSAGVDQTRLRRVPVLHQSAG